MVRALVSLALWTAALGAADPPELQQIRTVYLLPMGNGLDQYLANHLTKKGLFQVVTDPSLADAVFTDQLGQGFEQRMEELYPRPQTAAEKEKEASDAAVAGGAVIRPSSFGRGRGTLFLVYRRSKHVVWSIYERPKRTTPDVLDRTAERVAERLERALKPQK